MKFSTGYTLLCLIVPLFWGLISSRIFDAWQARRSQRQAGGKPSDQAENSDMYHI